MFVQQTSLLAYKTLANVRSECRPHKKQYIDVVAGVEDIDGVDGGVLILKPPCREPFGEVAVITGEGMLYLNEENIYFNYMIQKIVICYLLPSVFQWYSFSIHGLPLTSQMIDTVFAGQNPITIGVIIDSRPAA